MIRRRDGHVVIGGKWGMAERDEWGRFVQRVHDDTHDQHKRIHKRRSPHLSMKNTNTQSRQTVSCCYFTHFPLIHVHCSRKKNYSFLSFFCHVQCMCRPARFLNTRRKNLKKRHAAQFLEKGLMFVAQHTVGILAETRRKMKLNLFAKTNKQCKMQPLQFSIERCINVFCGIGFFEVKIGLEKYMMNISRSDIYT